MWRRNNRGSSHVGKTLTSAGGLRAKGISRKNQLGMKERKVAVVGSGLYAAHSHSNRRAAHFRRVVFYVAAKEESENESNTQDVRAEVDDTFC